MQPAELMASLHNHTDRGSLLDSTLTVQKLVGQAKELGFKAVGLTEHGNMTTYIDFYKECKKQGIKGILGCEVYETDDLFYKESDAKRYHLLLLAKNEIGLQNLMQIVSIGFTDGFYQKPRIDRNLLAQFSEGLICTSSCLASRLMRLLVKGFCPCCGKNNNEHEKDCDDNAIFEPKWKQAQDEIQIYKTIFGDDFYIELQSHGTYDQKIGNQRILKLAKETNTKTIITFDSHMEAGDTLTMDIHRKFIKIAQDREVDTTYQDCYQQDMETMYGILRGHMDENDIDEAVKNTGELADKCNVEIELGVFKMPQMETPPPFKSQMDYFKHLIEEGWYSRGIDKLSEKKQAIYRARIEEEIPVLDELGFINYFIMNYKLLTKISERGIPKGYSRGSGAGSLCFYLLHVTEIDSVKWDLDFSRFANLGRKGSIPDYDIDISKYRRGEAIEIAEELFGNDRVAHVCTFNSLSSKVAIRDLGKVFDSEGIYNLPYSVRDKIAKLIPEGLDIDEALNESGELRKFEKKYPLLFEYTRALENKPKSIGCHASAIAVSDRPMVELCPLMVSKEGRLMIHLEMNNAQDDLGLVKLDLLGLATTDIVDNTLKFAGLTWDDINIDKLDLADPLVYEEIYGKGNTIGIFQMESYVAQNLLKNLEPNHIEDIISVNALNRPALLSVGMDKTFIHNKHNPQKIKYLNKELKPIFERTRGIMLYQEQALSVFQLAGFPIEERDNARRAIGKKKKEVMEKLEDKFFEGLLERQTGWHVHDIKYLWDLLIAQSEYSFNRSHAVAYALLSYVCAYLKCHYPREFITACLINAIGDYPETSKFIAEARKMGLTVVNPSLNRSHKQYTLDSNERNILFGFVSIKGIGESSVETILEERKKGKFKSFMDFYNRCKVNSTTIISLIKAGAFGNTKEYKETLLLRYAELTSDYKEYKPVKTVPQKKVMYKYELIQSDEEFKDKELMLERYNAYKKQKHEETQQQKMDKHFKIFREKYMQDPEMYEFETLSMFLNSNPFDRYKSYFKDFEEYGDGHEKMLLGGTISGVDRKKSKSGTAYAYIELLFPNGQIREGMAFSEVYTNNQDLIKVGTNVVMLAKKSGDQFIVSKMKAFNKWKLEIKLKEQKERNEINE
jgi:DNA polymerase III subunit alpha